VIVPQRGHVASDGFPAHPAPPGLSRAGGMSQRISSTKLNYLRESIVRGYNRLCKKGRKKSWFECSGM
jgi:hypothetical protein